MLAPVWMPRSDLAARLLGLAAAVVGGGLLYWQVVGALEEMREGVANVQYSLTLILFGEMFALLGILWMVRGLAGYQSVRNLQQRPAAKKILVAATIILGGLSWWFMREQMVSYGYEMR